MSFVIRWQDPGTLASDLHFDQATTTETQSEQREFDRLVKEAGTGDLSSDEEQEEEEEEVDDDDDDDARAAAAPAARARARAAAGDCDDDARAAAAPAARARAAADDEEEVRLPLPQVPP